MNTGKNFKNSLEEQVNYSVFRLRSHRQGTKGKLLQKGLRKHQSIQQPEEVRQQQEKVDSLPQSTDAFATLPHGRMGA